METSRVLVIAVLVLVVTEGVACLDGNDTAGLNETLTTEETSAEPAEEVTTSEESTSLESFIGSRCKEDEWWDQQSMACIKIPMVGLPLTCIELGCKEGQICEQQSNTCVTKAAEI